MCRHAADAEPEPAGDNPAEHLRRAIERDYPLLFRRIGTLVYRLCGRLRREEAEGRIAETLNEAVTRALQAAEGFDSSRSALAWLLGFASRILQERQRERAKRPVVQSDLGEDRWRQVVEELCGADSDAATIRL